MKKLVSIILCLVIVFSLTACGNKKDVEVELKAEDVQDIILNYFTTNGVNDDNYIDSKVDTERNVVVVKLKNISEDIQNEFIDNVFTSRTGSIYIKYLREHSMIVFEKSE